MAGRTFRFRLVLAPFYEFKDPNEDPGSTFVSILKLVGGGTLTPWGVNTWRLTGSPPDGLVDVRFDLVTHDVNFAAGIGGGHLEVPAGTSVGNSYVETVNDMAGASTVTAVADADPDYTFVNWTVVSGDLDATFSSLSAPALTITNVTGPVEVQANFAIVTHDVNFAAGIGGGHLEVPAGTSVGNSYVETVNDMAGASTVTAVADADPDYTFVNWTVVSGDLDATFSSLSAPALTITNVTGPVEVQANFAIVTHDVNFAAGIGGGHLEVPAGTSVGNSYVETVNDMAGASTVTAVADADPDYTFVNWTVVSGDLDATFSSLSAPALTITNVTGPVEVQANFAIVTHDVNFAAGIGGGHLEVPARQFGGATPTLRRSTTWLVPAR